MKINNFLKFIIAVGVSELAGVIGSVFTASAIPTWYASLEKPALNPPGLVFGPVWTALYFLIGVAAFLIWKKLDEAGPAEKSRPKIALAIFGLQLAFNAVWSVIFFGLQNPGAAFLDIIALWFAIILTVFVFYKISKPAAVLLLPYLAWVTFAAYLNFAIWMLN